MKFEFDKNKSSTNLSKHGISFQTAQQLWKDPSRVEIPARTESEERFLVVGRIEQKVWSAVITYRESRIRIISVRRARDKEATLYDEKEDH